MYSGTFQKGADKIDKFLEVIKAAIEVRKPSIFGELIIAFNIHSYSFS